MKKVAIIGFGNLGFHLAKHLSHFHHVRIFQRNDSKHSPISRLVPTEYDFIILCVPDSAIEAVAQSLPKSEVIWLHTSGSTSLDTLSSHPNHGVVYPLHTFSREKAVDFTSFPFFIEGSKSALTPIIAFVETFTKNYHILDSHRRLQLHLAAVMVCNFSNHLLGLAEKQLKVAQIDLKVLKDLLLETIDKAIDIGAAKAQTGPASRNDINTIQKHLNLLEGIDWEVYKLITKSIQKNR